MQAPRERDQLLEGTRALESSDWEAARATFEAALEISETPDALDGLGLALCFLGRREEGIAARERAFDGFVRERRCNEAAQVAVWVSHQHLVAGRGSAARGWLARAERALEGVPGCAGHGWVAIERARHARGVDEQIEHARRGMEIARECGDGDLEVFALSLLGRVEVSAGRPEEGMPLLEEAMVAASAGRVRNVYTLSEAYCNLVTACTDAGDWERATEWCDHVNEFARTQAPASGMFNAACRTVHAHVLLATGRWSDAEIALESALATHGRQVPEWGAPTVAAMAELRVRQGRLGEAERLLAGREEHPWSLRALALLRIAVNEPRMAVGLLERGLQTTAGDTIRATWLLAPLVDARLACGDAEGAAAAARELAQLADASGMRLVAARAALAEARVAVAAGRLDDAAERARSALGDFGALAMPLDVGEARLELARALAVEAPELARDQARTALGEFRKLGASRAMDAAAAVLRDLGSPTGARPRAAGELTAREQEVLRLIALGMSNARIAETLVISEKTAAHHVGRILRKLGVSNRTEAAAHAQAAAPLH